MQPGGDIGAVEGGGVPALGRDGTKAGYGYAEQ